MSKYASSNSMQESWVVSSKHFLPGGLSVDGSPGVGARPRVARVGEDVVGAARAVPKREVRRHVLARAPVDLLRVRVRLGSGLGFRLVLVLGLELG